MESTNDPTVPKSSKVLKDGATLGGPGTDLFPESIRIEVLMLLFFLCKCMIELGSLLCNCVRLVDGVVFGFGTFFKHFLTHVLD